LIFDKHANRYISSLAALSIIIAFGLTNLASAQQLDAQAAEEIVRNIYFEGFPEDEAREIGPAGAARLIEILGSPDESSAHANVLLALGLCGQPGALEAIRDWAAETRSGEIDRDTFRAWQALPFALGHLLDHTPGAVALLEAQLNAAPPEWSFRHHRGNRLRAQARRGAAIALGRSVRPEARRALDRAAKRTDDRELREVLRDARAMSTEVVR
jgi:hypothetical protein